MFGASTPAPSGGLFGASTPAAGGGLFGASAPATPATGGGLFGASAAKRFGAPKPAGGLFGAAPSTPATGGGLFGASTAASTPAAGGLFGASAPHWRRVVWCRSPAPTPGGGLFGAASSAAATPAFGGFGASSAVPTLGSAPAASGGVRRGGDASIDAGGGLLARRRQPRAAGLFGASAPAAGASPAVVSSVRRNRLVVVSLVRLRARAVVYSVPRRAPGRLRVADCSVRRSIVCAERRFVRCSAGDRWRLVRRLCAGGWRQHFRWWSGLGAAERGCARSVRRATGGGNDSVRVAVAAPQLALATTEPAPAKQSLLGKMQSPAAGAAATAFPVRSLTPRSPWLTSRGGISREPKPRGAVSVLSPGGAAQSVGTPVSGPRPGSAVSVATPSSGGWLFKPRENPRALFIRPEGAAAFARRRRWRLLSPQRARTKPGASSSALRR